MSTIAKTSFSNEELDNLAEAGAITEAEAESFEAFKVSEDELTDAAPAVPAKAEAFKVAQIDHSIFETQKLNEGAKIRYSSTFDDVTLFNALNSSSESIAEHFGKDLKIVHMVVTTAQVSSDFNDDFAEKEDKPCVHFFTEEGLHLASVSNGIIRSTENLITCGFMPTPEAPIVIRFKEIKTKRGTAHTFDLVSR